MEDLENVVQPTETTPAPEPVSTPEPEPAAAPEPAASPEPEPILAPEEPKEITSAVQENGTKMTLFEDPITGKRSVIRDVSAVGQPPAQETPAAEAPKAEEPKVEQKKPSDALGEYWNNQESLMNGIPKEGEDVKPYSVDEFAQMVATNQQFDERRIPPELSKHYADVKVARAMQESTARAKAAEQAQKQAEAKMMTPEEQKAIRQEFYRELDKQARNAALSDMGMTEEQLNNMQYNDEADPQVLRDFDNSYAFHKQELINKLQADSAKEQYAKTQQQAVYRDIVDFTLNAQKTEKNFKLIDAAMTTRYKYLPYEQGRVIGEALTALQNGNITPKQAETIRNYYESTRKEFYAYKNGLKANGQPTPAAPKPPVVENAGNGKDSIPGTKYTVNDLRNATRPSDKQAIIAALLANRMH